MMRPRRKNNRKLEKERRTAINGHRLRRKKGMYAREKIKKPKNY